MRILRKGTVFAGVAGSDRAKCCFPWLTQLADGKIIASFQAASKKNGIDSHVLILSSDDLGLTWSEPSSPFQKFVRGTGAAIQHGFLNEVEPGRLVANLMWCDHFSNPDLELFHPETGGCLPIDIYLSESGDGGLTWIEPNKLEPPKFAGVPLPVMGPVYWLGDGSMICPFETSKSYDDAGPWKHYSAYFVSHDNGLTWPECKVTAHDPTHRVLYCDHRIAKLGGDVLVDVFWTFDTATGNELNMTMSISTDGGKNWTAPADTGLQGQGWPIAVDGDTFALISVDRPGTQSIRIFLTDNLGQTWDAAEPLVLYDHRSASSDTHDLNDWLTSQADWSYGLPSGIRLSDGNLLTCWYGGDEKTTNINCALIEV